MPRHPAAIGPVFALGDVQPGPLGACTRPRAARGRCRPRRGSRSRTALVARGSAPAFRLCARRWPGNSVRGQQGLRLHRHERVAERRRGAGSRCLASGARRVGHSDRSSLPRRSGAGRALDTMPASTRPKFSPCTPSGCGTCRPADTSGRRRARERAAFAIVTAWASHRGRAPTCASAHTPPALPSQ